MCVCACVYVSCVSSACMLYLCLDHSICVCNDGGGSDSDEKQPGLLSEADVRNFAFQVACGLEHLKTMNVSLESPPPPQYPRPLQSSQTPPIIPDPSNHPRPLQSFQTPPIIPDPSNHPRPLQSSQTPPIIPDPSSPTNHPRPLRDHPSPTRPLQSLQPHQTPPIIPAPSYRWCIVI